MLLVSLSALLLLPFNCQLLPEPVGHETVVHQFTGHHYLEAHFTSKSHRVPLAKGLEDKVHFRLPLKSPQRHLLTTAEYSPSFHSSLIMMSKSYVFLLVGVYALDLSLNTQRGVRYPCIHFLQKLIVFKFP